MNIQFVFALLALSSALAFCNLPSGSQVRETALETATIKPAAVNAPTTNETPLVAAAPSVIDTMSPNVIQLGDLRLIPFAPPWFEGDMAKTVFLENGLLRIDSPQESLDPPGRNRLTGVVIEESNDKFDISAMFNAEGGACRGVDHPCGNTYVTNCIVFDFIDLGNYQEFCIEASSLFWTLIAFENEAVGYHSSVQTSNAIHDTGDIFRGKHPIPNELRLTLLSTLLTGYINGQQVFQRDGSNVDGKIGAACSNWSSDPGDLVANCEITLVVPG